ncbi:hypothetical protein QTP88_025855 [Uroleucon formosanum]
MQNPQLNDFVRPPPPFRHTAAALACPIAHRRRQPANSTPPGPAPGQDEASDTVSCRRVVHGNRVATCIFRHVERVKKYIPPMGDGCGEGLGDARRIWQKSKWRNYSVDRRVEPPWPVEQVVEMKCSANNGPSDVRYRDACAIVLRPANFTYDSATHVDTDGSHTLQRGNDPVEEKGLQWAPGVVSEKRFN